jgi:flagellar basal-body rod protein FlgF
MESTAYIALSRQMVLDRQMDVIAHNIANATTTGFKASALLLEPVPVDAGEHGEHQRLAFVQDVGMVRDLDPGPVTTTGNPFDLAIEGAGYLAIQTAAGVRYARSGQLHVNDQGELATAAGDPVLDDGGASLAIPLDAGPIAIAAEGTVSTPTAVIGRLDLVTFANEQRLVPVGDGLYRTDQPPLPATEARLVQGALEGSNVRPIIEMVQMMATLRAYQGTQRLIETDDDLQRRAIEHMLETTG